MADEGDIAALLDALTEKQRRFCEAYAGEAAGNGVRACELAGYEGNKVTLASVAYENIRKPQIRAVLAAFQEQDPLVPSRIDALRDLGRIQRGEVSNWKMTGTGELVELPTTPEQMIAAIQELGKLRGDYVTKVANTNAAGDDVEGLPLAQLLALARIDPGKLGE